MTPGHKCNRKQGDAKNDGCSLPLQDKAEKGCNCKDCHGEDEQACQKQVDEDL